MCEPRPLSYINGVMKRPTGQSIALRRWREVNAHDSCRIVEGYLHIMFPRGQPIALCRKGAGYTNNVLGPSLYLKDPLNLINKPTATVQHRRHTHMHDQLAARGLPRLDRWPKMQKIAPDFCDAALPKTAAGPETIKSRCVDVIKFRLFTTPMFETRS